MREKIKKERERARESERKHFFSKKKKFVVNISSLHLTNMYIIKKKKKQDFCSKQHTQHTHNIQHTDTDIN